MEVTRGNGSVHLTSQMMIMTLELYLISNWSILSSLLKTPLLTVGFDLLACVFVVNSKDLGRRK